VQRRISTEKQLSEIQCRIVFHDDLKLKWKYGKEEMQGSVKIDSKKLPREIDFVWNKEH